MINKELNGWRLTVGRGPHQQGQAMGVRVVDVATCLLKVALDVAQLEISLSCPLVDIARIGGDNVLSWYVSALQVCQYRGCSGTRSNFLWLTGPKVRHFLLKCNFKQCSLVVVTMF